MAVRILRLRLSLLVAAGRQGVRGRARHIVGLIVLGAGVVLAWVGLVSLRDVSDVVAQAVTTVGGSAVALGFLLAPVLSGAPDQLDPRRFRPFGLTTGRLAGGIILASLGGMPVIGLLVVAAGVAVLWLGHDAGLMAVAGPLLGALTAVLAARVAGAVTAAVLREHRSRELVGLFVLTLLLVVVPVGVFLASLGWQGQVPSALTIAVRALSFTPFGAAWALPGAVAVGDPLTWVVALCAVTWTTVLAVAWVALVDRALHAPDAPRTSRTDAGMSWFAVMPRTPAGAIAARSLIYWVRDRRYRVNVAIVPVAAVLAAVPLLIAGMAPEYVALLPLPIAALFFGWLPHNDLAYDSTAVWLHFASGVRGIADRLGRLVPILFVAVPVFAVFVPVTALVSGHWELVPALVGVSVALFLCGLGLSSIASAVAPYPVSRPGDSPFHQPQRTGGAGLGAQALVMVGTVVCTAPTLWWAWLAVTRDAAYGVAALVAGVATGLVVLGIGLAIGSFVFERRGSALMEFAESAA